MSGIKAPILSIMSRLQSVTDIQFIRIWNNQLKYVNNGNGYDWPRPAAFVEVVVSPVYEQIGVGFQNSDIGFRIHLVHEQLDAQDGTLDQNVAVFDLRDKVNQALSLFEPTACGPLVKRSETLDDDHTNIYHYILEYVCSFIDSTGSPYDDSAKKYIDSTPPTDLQVTVVDDTIDQVDNIKFNQTFKII